MSWLDKLISKKSSSTFWSIIRDNYDKVIWTPRKYDKLAEEGYKINPYVYACINQIAKGCAGIPWVLREIGAGENGKQKEIHEHPILNLIQRPNPQQGQSSFIENTMAFLLISGNAYIEGAEDSNGIPQELYSLRPDRMKIVKGDKYEPVGGYIYDVNNNKTPLDKDKVLHLKLFNPLDDWYGMSPIEAAARSIDQNNESRKWNVQILQNEGKPAGVFSTENNLEESAFARLKRQIKEDWFKGSKTAGEPILLEGGLKWIQTAFSAKDLDWLKGLNLSAKEIAIAYNVPPELIGDSGNKTYSNYKEARKALYMETILPYMDFLRDELNNWLVIKFDGNYRLDYDKDQIEILQDDRDKVFDMSIKAYTEDVLTKNESRLLMGYGEINDGDKFYSERSQGNADGTEDNSEGQEDGSEEDTEDDNNKTNKLKKKN